MEPIAIIGIGCRFPGAKNPQTFWQLLHDGVDAITEVPPDRWDVDAFYNPVPATPEKMYTRWGGFLKQVAQFEPSFFGISPHEAVSIDPQQRLLLEVTWEALENAGITPNSLAGSQTGVFIGISSLDYHKLQYKDLSSVNAYSGTGTTLSIAANRLSYVLNLRGPSLAIDTACSSSLVALHYACQSLLNQETNLCLVGGVSLILSPDGAITFSQARMMAADGRCKTFDASADGYVRGEGCGVVVLKRLSDALRDGDNIQALIRSSAVNQDGLTNGLTAPNGPSQQAVIRQALQKAGLKPAQISYVEAHGTGTSLGDPIEVKSLKTVLMEGREPDCPCWIGSVKTNIGHLEAAAGMAGLLKVVLSLQQGEIPPHLHLKQLNPYIHLENTPLSIPTELTKWSVGEERRFAGVSSFGFGGTNAHVILEEAPLPVKSEGLNERPLHLLTLSAKSEPALLSLAQRYQEFLSQHPTASLADICFTANTGRSHFDHRLAVVAETTEQLRQQLINLESGTDTTGLVVGQLTSKKPPKIAFLFTGQGSQYIGMGRQLYETQPTFKAALDRCAKILDSYLDQPLLEILYPPPTINNQQLTINNQLNQTAYTQPALFAIEYALAQLWQSWGIKPDVVMGHSVGEYVAASVAGVFSLEDGLKLIAHRGRLMQQLPPGGKMVALMASEAQVREAITPYSSQVSIAALNGPQSVVISGEAKSIEEICSKLEAQGIKTKPLQVSHAFHSPLMEPMLAEFEAVASQVTYQPPRTPLISNLTGQRADESITAAQYWVRHVRQPVRFAQSMETLHQQEVQVFLEIGPKPILLGMGRQCLPEDVGVWLPSLRPPRADWQQMLASLGQLYVQGVAIDWLGFDCDYSRRKVVLPTYPFQRQRYWIEIDDRGQQQQTLSKSETPAAQAVLQSKFLQQLQTATPKQRQELLGSYIKKQMIAVLGLDPALSLDLDQPLSELGIDSLMMIELNNLFKKGLGIVLPPEKLLRNPSLTKLEEIILRELGEQGSLSLNNQFPEFSNSAVNPATNDWIIYRQPNPEARLRLFCLHYLGGSASAFRNWSKELEELAPDIEVCPIELPGRKSRMDEQPFEEMEPLVQTLAQELLPYLDKPFAFYGHSMGALISFELARQLRRQSSLIPVYLFAAAYYAPHLPNPFQSLCKWTDSMLIQEFPRLLDVHQKILEDADFIQALLPTFKADLQILSSYIYREEDPLDCPIFAFCGRQDIEVKPDHLLAWQQHTRSNFKLQIFPGKHLFMLTDQKMILSTIAQELNQLIVI